MSIWYLLEYLPISDINTELIHFCAAVCVGQGWGPPQYRCSTSADLLGQAVHLYQVAVPRVSATWIPGSPNTDRHLALISCAEAGLHAITTASQVCCV